MFINIHIWKRWVSTFAKLTLKSQSSYLYNHPRIAKLTLAIQITTTLGTQNLWPLLTGGRCSEVALRNEN
jgi:hypothetical protein